MEINYNIVLKQGAKGSKEDGLDTALDKLKREVMQTEKVAFVNHMPEIKDDSLAQRDEKAFIEQELKRSSLNQGLKKRNSTQVRTMMAVFKAVPREEAQIYKVNQRTKLNNDGIYQKSYKMVDADLRIPDFSIREMTKPREGNSRMPICLESADECNYQGRMLIKRILQNSKQVKLNPIQGNQKVSTKELDSSMNAKQSERLQDSYGKRENLSMMLQQRPERDSLLPLRRSKLLKINDQHRDHRDHNQASIDKYEHIPSPIPFSKQIERIPFYENSGITASEERFSSIPKADLRFKRIKATDFSKWKPKCIEEFLTQGNSGIIDLNAFNQVYHPKFKLVKEDLGHGVPMFDKVVSRSQLQKSKEHISPEGYDHHKIGNALDHHLSQFKSPQRLVRFKSQIGRAEGSGFQSSLDLVPDYVSFLDFLPNSIKYSPLKRDHSQSNQTARYYPNLIKNYQSTLNETKIEVGSSEEANEIQKMLFTKGSQVFFF